MEEKKREPCQPCHAARKTPIIGVIIAIKPKDRIDILFEYSKSIDSRNVKVVGFGKWKNYKFNEI